MKCAVPLRQVLAIPALLLIALIPSCVSKDEYVILEKKNEAVKAQLVQAREEMAAQTKKTTVILDQVTAAQEETAKARQETAAIKKELEALKKEYESFKGQRRAAMVGKTYPEVALANGKKLRDAVIKAFTLSMVTFMHADGLSKVPLKDLSEDIKWDAVYNEAEAKIADEEYAKQDEQRQADFAAFLKMTDQQMAALSRAELDHKIKELSQLLPRLNTALSAARAELNKGYQAHAARPTGRPTASAGASAWNSATPETNAFSLGMTGLESKRDAINATLRQITDVNQQLKQAHDALAALPAGK